MVDVPISPDDYSELVSLLYRSVLDEKCWTSFMQKLARSTETQRTQLFGFDTQREETFGLIQIGYEQSFVDSYLAFYHTSNFWTEKLLSMPTGVVFDSMAIIEDVDLRRSEYYNDWLVPQGDIIQGGAVSLFSENSRALYLGANYPYKSGPDANKKWMAYTKLLVPHIQQAFSLSAALSFERLAKRLPNLRTNDAFEPAFLVVDERSKVLFANGLACELLDAGHIISYALGDRLAFEQSNLQMAYLKMLKELATGAGPFGYHNSTYHHQRGAFLVNFARIEAGEFRIPQLFQYDRPCVFIAITRNRDNELLAQKLALGYGLTKTECEVASQFHQGLSIDEIAQLREKSPNTVRNQIKTIMQKLDVRGSVQLLLRLNQIA